MRVPTMRVKFKDGKFKGEGVFKINASDFDPALHEEVSGHAEAPKADKGSKK